MLTENTSFIQGHEFYEPVNKFHFDGLIGLNFFSSLKKKNIFVRLLLKRQTMHELNLIWCHLVLIL